jgi:hypothetical protein
VVELRLGMPIRLHRQDERVGGCGGMVALSRGPLVYCLESIDNALDIFAAEVRPDSFVPIRDEALLGGVCKIQARAGDGETLTFIPYMLWANRGPSRMTVFFRDGSLKAS